MRSMSRIPVLAGLLALAALIPGSVVNGQKKEKDENIKPAVFKTADGVTLEGILYKNTSKDKKDAVVILLHDFSHKDGGDSTKGELQVFAEQMYKEGYSVLTFDFRGFGKSTEVKESFWQGNKNGHNRSLIKGWVKTDLPKEIEHKNFKTTYYPFLLYDIAAAKAFLDRRSDAGEVNSHNTIVIGAGQGATLGAIWVANENVRRKDKRGKNALVAPRFEDLTDEPESRDIAACIWLSIKPSVEGRNMLDRMKYLVSGVVKTQKIPMGFYFGEKNETDSRTSSEMVSRIKREVKGAPVDTKPIKEVAQSGAKILDKSARAQIIKDLNSVMADRGARENTRHDTESSAFYYINHPGDKKKLPNPKLNKENTEEVPPVDLTYLGVYP